MNCLIRPMQYGDVADVLRVQYAVYAEPLWEDADFFANRLELAGVLCWVAQQDSVLVGYLVSYPWHEANPPKLNVSLVAIPAGADSWFIHDCAVLPDQQGQGIAKQLWQAAAGAACQAGLRRASLVALADAVNYWRYIGFAAAPEGLVVLDGYGSGACYMVRALAAGEFSQTTA